LVPTKNITGFELTTDIAFASPPTLTKCVIFADSQAAIPGLSKPGKQSRQAALISAINKIHTLISDQRQMSVEIKWILGHEGVWEMKTRITQQRKLQNRKEMVSQKALRSRLNQQDQLSYRKKQRTTGTNHGTPDLKRHTVMHNN